MERSEYGAMTDRFGSFCLQSIRTRPALRSLDTCITTSSGCRFASRAAVSWAKRFARSNVVPFCNGTCRWIPFHPDVLGKA